MNTALTSIETLLAHPAPGVVFDPHERATLPKQAHPSRHALGSALSDAERDELIKLTGGAPQLADLVDLYQHSNGVDLFYLKCPHCDDPHWALSFLPVSRWAAATAPWQPDGDTASFMEGCDLYQQGEWRVIASMPNESMNLVQFFSGERGTESLAGKIFCIGLDGYLGFEEEVAPSLSSLLDEIVRNPAAFFNRLGFTWVVATDQDVFGAPIEEYVPDLRDHPDATPWPPTRPR